MAQVELLPCPSGHNEARVVRDFHFHVECMHHDCPWEIRNLHTRAEAIEAWNTRTPSPATGSAVPASTVAPSPVGEGQPVAWRYRIPKSGIWAFTGDEVAAGYFEHHQQMEVQPLYLAAQAPKPASGGGELDAIELHPATKMLVHDFALALANKLSAAEKKYGYSDNWARIGWADECREHLREHVEKGDPRDVAAYCAFLWFHGDRTSIAAEADTAKP